MSNALQTWWNNLKTRWRKHQFDLDNPAMVNTSVEIRGSVFSFPLYTCRVCGKSLALDLWEMKDLPFEMERGCPGERVSK